MMSKSSSSGKVPHKKFLLGVPRIEINLTLCFKSVAIHLTSLPAKIEVRKNSKILRGKQKLA